MTRAPQTNSKAPASSVRIEDEGMAENSGSRERKRSATIILALAAAAKLLPSVAARVSPPKMSGNYRQAAQRRHGPPGFADARLSMKSASLRRAHARRYMRSPLRGYFA